MRHTLTPAAARWLVRGGGGKVCERQIVTYDATPTGTVGSGDGGLCFVKVAAL